LIDVEDAQDRGMLHSPLICSFVMLKTPIEERTSQSKN
jgi:hypothetical protein